MQTGSSSPNGNAYRKDIDGLRGIAVLSVILFHIDSRLLGGGFVGVDIFFVISGYLISLHIFSDIERSRFSLTEFYRRRIKRIAPPMLAVVAATLLVAQVTMLPADAERAAESALWSVISLANVYFWLHQDTSYFATASHEQPLLHLWSLGVEEQFYIFWPLILMTFYRPTRASAFVIASIAFAAVSFALGDVLFDWDPSFVYYMLPTRAGELLIGALAAQWVLRKRHYKPSPTLVHVAAWIGVTMMTGSLILMPEDGVFPGWRAAVPTIGTATIIVAGHHSATWPTVALRWRPLVWVGLISYSAYLWHWPLLAFARYFGVEIDAVSGTLIFTMTLVAAWLSYRFIEQPARATRRTAVSVAIRQYFAPAGALTILALVAMKFDGYGPRLLSQNYKERLATVRHETRPAYYHDYVCQRQLVTAKDLSDPNCVIEKDERESPRALLWGDSNAAHYVGMLGEFANREKYSFRNVEVGSCPPLDTDSTEFVRSERAADCRASFEVIAPILDDYTVVWISANWSGYQARSDRFLDEFSAMLDRFTQRGQRVVLIGKIPALKHYDPLCKEKALSLPFLNCQVTPEPIDQHISEINLRLQNIAEDKELVEYFDANALLCPHGMCAAVDGAGAPLYADSSHLTMEASWKLGKQAAAERTPAPFRRLPGSTGIGDSATVISRGP
jgi:peptidoglycan/LPS O-acetylase OafA/YrhL